MPRNRQAVPWRQQRFLGCVAEIAHCVSDTMSSSRGAASAGTAGTAGSAGRLVLIDSGLCSQLPVAHGRSTGRR
jgi:hypothetical protein